MDSSNITKINFNESIHNEMTFVPEKWPWKVLFVSGGKFFCEGSLIDDEWILTSADCTEKHSKNNKNAGMEVVLGYHYVDQLPYSHTKRRVRDILIHPKYNLVKNQYNFALVRLSQVKLSTNVSTISLPDQDCRSLPYGTICHIVSSNFHEDDLNTTVFKKISMKIISNSECQQLYGNKLSIRDSMFCAKHIENGGSVYQGFLGGSLVCYDKKMSRFIQMGVNNGSPKNTGIHVPIMFGKTSKVRRWIDETIAKHNN